MTSKHLWDFLNPLSLSSFHYPYLPCSYPQNWSILEPPSPLPSCGRHMCMLPSTVSPTVANISAERAMDLDMRTSSDGDDDTPEEDGGDDEDRL